MTEKYGFIDVEKVTATDAGEKKYSCAGTDPGEHNVGLVVPAPGDSGDELGAGRADSADSRRRARPPN